MAHPSHQAKKPIDAKDYWMGIGIALGAGVGMLFGTLAGNLPMGIAVGVRSESSSEQHSKRRRKFETVVAQPKARGLRRMRP
jgi:hypothetical protein